MDTIELAGMVASRIALGTWAIGGWMWGARRPDQLDATGDVAGWSLDAAALREIDAILGRTITNPVGPEFMAPPAAPAERAVA